MSNGTTKRTPLRGNQKRQAVMGKAASAVARQMKAKMDELKESSPEVEVTTLTFAITTPDGDDVEVSFAFPVDRGISILKTIAQMEQFGPGTTSALIEMGDPSVLEFVAKAKEAGEL